jgi:hypothetical protein
MNAETLQFFLTYPTEREDEIVQIKSAHEDDDLQAPTSPVSKPVQVGTVEVDFPLYGRALEYCSAHQDNFIRVTAMNICLNTLRLATVSPVEANDSIGEKESRDVSFGPQSLPLRERLAIAQHVCSPDRVESLVSPIFTKLAQLWGSMDEQIREIDLLREGIIQQEGGTRVRDSKMEKAKLETKRKKLTDSLQNTVADMQDELLLLEDVFKVGLTSLNEQTIEMMLATFVYPLLLQPLLLYMQRFGAHNQALLSTMTDVLSKGAKTGVAEAGADIAESDRIQDAAPAKTALFTLSAVFQLITNQPLMRLMITALFHPLAPDSSGETMIRAKPDVAGIGPDGQLCVRVDAFGQEEAHKIGYEKSPYSFGNATGQKSVRGDSLIEDDSRDTTAAILAAFSSVTLCSAVNGIALKVLRIAF